MKRRPQCVGMPLIGFNVDALLKQFMRCMQV